MLRRLGSVVLLLAALNAARADASFLPGQFQCHFREGLLGVEVELQGNHILHFLVDSGASASILNLPAAQKLGIKFGKKTSIAGMRASAEAHWSPELTLKIGDGFITQKFLIANLHALSGITSKVDGLIGADFFAGKIVEINFVTETIRLLDDAPLEKRPFIPLKITPEGTFLLAASVNRNPTQWFRLDTGCSSSLQWVTGCANSSMHSPETSVALATRTALQSFSSFEAGGIFLDGVPTALRSTPLFGGEAGLIGNGLLSRFSSVVIDVRSGRLIPGEQRNAIRPDQAAHHFQAR